MDKNQIKPSFKSYFYLQENTIKNKDIIYDLIVKLKYENPSEIQIKIIKSLNSLEKEEDKKDKVSCTIIKAETGTGKTLAYLIELLQSIDFSKENEIQGLIITPTRELALQTEEYINKIINLKYKILIGGKANIPGKIKKEKIDRNNVPTIIVGTLGKLREVLLKKNKKTLKNKKDNLLSNIRCIIVDEADKMISQNKPPNNLFESFLKYLLEYLFKNNENNIYKQFILCSASLDDKTELFYTNLISNYINKDRNEIFKYFKTENDINEKDEKIVNDNIKEYNINFYNKKHESFYEQKYKILIIILSSLQKKYNQCLIFYNKKNKGEELSQDLRNYGFSTCFIHGELSQDERQLIYSKIKNLEYKIILSTDLLSRGIDLTAVNLVINFDEAFDNIEHYHRIGRTGRFFEKGIVISFYENKNDDKELLKNDNNYKENEIENVIKIIENEFILSERLSKEEIEKINKGENKNNSNVLKEALTEINGVNILLQKKRKLQFENESLIKEDINLKEKNKIKKNEKLERNEIKENILINERPNSEKKSFCLYCNFMKIFDV